MARFPVNKGFVLSFSTFALALFLVIFAQIQAAHIQTVQWDASDVTQLARPARVMRDVSLDFNALTGTALRVDQNSTHATLFVSGLLPSPLSLSTNLLRYQTNVARWGRDSNTFVGLDFNQTISSQQLSGRTNHGLSWYHSLDTNTFYAAPRSTGFFPQKIDVNITSDVAHGNGASDLIITNGDSNPDSDYQLTLRYSDTNASHAFTTTYNLDADDYYVYQFTYSSPDGNGIKFFEIGSFRGTPTPYAVVLRGDLNVTWTYAVSIQLPNDENGTRGGWDVNSTFRGKDFNVDTNTVWVV